MMLHAILGRMVKKTSQDMIFVDCLHSLKKCRMNLVNIRGERAPSKGKVNGP